MKHLPILTVLIMLAMVLPAKAKQQLDPLVVKEAHVWMDGNPILPPYEWRITGDSVLTVNGFILRDIRKGTREREAERVPEKTKRQSALNDSMSAVVRRTLATGGSWETAVSTAKASYDARRDLTDSCRISPRGHQLLVWWRGYHDPELMMLEGLDQPEPKPRDEVADLQATITMLSPLVDKGHVLFLTYDHGYIDVLPDRIPIFEREVLRAAAADTLILRQWKHTMLSIDASLVSHPNPLARLGGQ
jgi:hypothetical protein